MTDSTNLLIVVATTSVSAGVAIATVVITNFLTKRREHEADWRRLKLTQYQEFTLSLSGVVHGRATPEGHRRFADAVNNMTLVAPSDVLVALRNYLKETSYRNTERSDERHDRLFDALLRAMRKDIHPNRIMLGADFSFHLQAPPPEPYKGPE